MAKKGINLELKGSKKLIDAFKEQVDLGRLQPIIERNTIDVKDASRVLAPVKSGYMKKYIRTSKQKKGLQMTVRSNAPYSGFVEFGTVNQNAQPFIGPAVEQYKESFIQEVVDELSNKNKS